MIREKELTDDYVKREGILPFIDNVIAECKGDKKKYSHFDEQLRIRVARELRICEIEKHGDEIRLQICNSCDDNYRCRQYQEYLTSNAKDRAQE